MSSLTTGESHKIPVDVPYYNGDYGGNIQPSGFTGRAFCNSLSMVTTFAFMTCYAFAPNNTVVRWTTTNIVNSTRWYPSVLLGYDGTNGLLRFNTSWNDTVSLVSVETPMATAQQGIFVSGQSMIRVFDWTTGAPQRIIELPAMPKPCPLQMTESGILFAVCWSAIHAIDPNSGSLLWSKKQGVDYPYHIYKVSVIAGGLYLFGLKELNEISVVSRVRLGTGDVIWEMEGPTAQPDRWVPIPLAVPLGSVVVNASAVQQTTTLLSGLTGKVRAELQGVPPNNSTTWFMTTMVLPPAMTGELLILFLQDRNGTAMYSLDGVT